MGIRLLSRPRTQHSPHSERRPLPTPEIPPWLAPDEQLFTNLIDEVKKERTATTESVYHENVTSPSGHQYQVRFTDHPIKGSSAAIFRARMQGIDATHEKTVAFKVGLPFTIASKDQQALFLRESEKLAQSETPGVAQVYDAFFMSTDLLPEELRGSTDKTTGKAKITQVPVVVLQYFPQHESASLEEVVLLRKLTHREALAILRPLATTLDTLAKRRKILHRDVKPSNIMLTPYGPHLLDFGIAVLAGAKPEREYEPGTIQGTVAYLSPEILRGKQAASLASEVFALTVMLIKVLSQRLPQFLSDTEFNTMNSTLLNHYTIHRSVDTGLTPAQSKAVHDVFGKGLDEDPERRFRSCTELVDAYAKATGQA